MSLIKRISTSLMESCTKSAYNRMKYSIYCSSDISALPAKAQTQVRFPFSSQIKRPRTGAKGNIAPSRGLKVSLSYL